MLFFLENVNDGSVFYLTGKDVFFVGRKDCDILIQNDQSISRKHAIIRIKENRVSLEDCGSKYNTLYKDEKLQPNIETELKVGDTIQFGVCTSIYTLGKYNFVTTGTRLNSSVKSKLMNDLSRLGGKYVDQWTPECTHLTVEEISVTIKVLHALIDEKPVVVPTYWSKLAENVQKNLPPPNINKYNNPPVTEKLLNKIDYTPNPERKKLFKGKMFIFQTEKDRKQLEDVIMKSGGSSISWEKNPIALEDIESSSNEFLIIQTAGMTDSSLNVVIKEFSKRGKRTIPLQEIATSVLLCSCERDCNPTFNRLKEVFPASEPTEPTQNNALAANTASDYFNIRNCKVEQKEELLTTIPDTFEKKLGDSEMQVYPSTSNTAKEEASSSQSMKRLNSDKLEEAPSKRSKIDGMEIPKVKPEKRDTLLPKNVPSEKKMKDMANKLDKIETKEENRVNPFLMKNKRNIKDETEAPSESNPFKRIKTQTPQVSQIQEQNPFKVASLGSNKRRYENNGVESSSKKKREETTVHKPFSDTTNKRHSNTSNYSRVANKTIINGPWISKDSSIPTTTDKNIKMENDFDLEMKQFIEQFKNTVVVEVLCSIPRKSRIINDCVDGSKSKTRVNFKTFKKVLPVRPQSTIIGKVSLNPIYAGDTTGITDSRREFYNSDDEVEVAPKSKKKIPKKFVI